MLQFLGLEAEHHCTRWFCRCPRLRSHRCDQLPLTMGPKAAKVPHLALRYLPLWCKKTDQLRRGTAGCGGCLCQQQHNHPAPSRAIPLGSVQLICILILVCLSPQLWCKWHPDRQGTAVRDFQPCRRSRGHRSHPQRRSQVALGCVAPSLVIVIHAEAPLEGHNSTSLFLVSQMT